MTLSLHPGFKSLNKQSHVRYPWLIDMAILYAAEAVSIHILRCPFQPPQVAPPISHSLESLPMGQTLSKHFTRFTRLYV
jgi:hypothetical protein